MTTRKPSLQELEFSHIGYARVHEWPELFPFVFLPEPEDFSYEELSEGEIDFCFSTYNDRRSRPHRVRDYQPILIAKVNLINWTDRFGNFYAADNSLIPTDCLVIRNLGYDPDYDASLIPYTPEWLRANWRTYQHEFNERESKRRAQLPF